MPYIKTEIRKALLNREPVNSGELNYMVTQFCLSYLHTKEEKYQTYNDIIGVLQCVQLELYRRKISEYEEKKIKENGDISDYCI